MFRIGEVSRVTATKPFVLRFWETEFPMLQPVKSPKGHRLYRREDIDTVFTSSGCLYDEGFTIAGARRHLREQALGGNGTMVADTTGMEFAAESPAESGAETDERRRIRAAGRVARSGHAQPQDAARPA